MKYSEIELYGVIIRTVTAVPPGINGRDRNDFADEIATKLVDELVKRPELLDTLPPPPITTDKPNWKARAIAAEEFCKAFSEWYERTPKSDWDTDQVVDGTALEEAFLKWEASA